MANSAEIGQCRDNIATDNMAAGIVNTLKTKIKENAEELEKYEVLAEETKTKLTAEKKLREETENEVCALQRKIKLLEDNVERNEDRLEILTRNLQNTTESLETSDDGRYNISKEYHFDKLLSFLCLFEKGEITLSSKIKNLCCFHYKCL